MPGKVENSFKRIFDLFTSDLSLTEIERLVKRDAVGVYDFYLRDVEQPDQQQGKLMRAIKLIFRLFEAFLRKLTPARRLLYAVTLLLFVAGLNTGNTLWVITSFLLLNGLVAFELADKVTAKDELEVARDIQMGLMPKQPPSIPGLDIACFSEAAREVGGDYFDFLGAPGKTLPVFLAIGDVSGKGMGAALHMVQVQAILRNLCTLHRQPKKILVELNRQLRPLLNSNSFCTMSLARIDSATLITWARAGHMPTLLYRAETRQCLELTPEGMGVGMPENGQFEKALEEEKIALQPGDLLCFYTDGVVEARNLAEVEFGEARLKKIIIEQAGREAEAVRQHILSALAQFRGAAPTHDDLTLVVMKNIS